ncbi:ABC transporter ATP-binding protein [Agrobacterium vitis]|uniref:ABC transporter ATP-binding protein n=1 Tax=Agrobacterium vitis TaxID=373 RepID=UPI00087317C4|nr:ABC transporter ATP-binding protein [Agrobacterium vitis]MCE6076845.1 ATP-binding cassette domain-containing protein [Agrobacterium vitis]MCM2450074.1 ABC transporter ATP-binding protein [Agrobacterium vitis]MCM2470821.1 ABC transporter ATP-binding protein [Agrobacterium vitis]MUO71229.1 ATP-binding cassette domain-containing protein [Agrobacterium vitis]MUO84307.1 ATP-binding cassette domain-containing protein [Agrobacterium vitis]
MNKTFDELIVFTDVTKIFKTQSGSYTAIQDVTLSVGRGEIVMLLGPSGCGKSTLLNMTAGLLQPTVGQVRYQGKEVSDLNSHVAYMTQRDHLLPWRTVAANVALPLEVTGKTSSEITEHVAELLAVVGLTDFATAYPSQLSGGMQKRCALARLLAANRETLLLDEPFGALDAQLRLSLQAELLRLCRRLDLSVLFVTHDIEEAALLGDRCIIFEGGPGKIVSDIKTPLSKDRDLLVQRLDPAYHAFTNELWTLLTPSLRQDENSASSNVELLSSRRS